MGTQKNRLNEVQFRSELVSHFTYSFGESLVVSHFTLSNFGDTVLSNLEICSLDLS